MRALSFLSTMLLALLLAFPALAEIHKEHIYEVGALPPTDSEPLLKAGDVAPDFELPSTKHATVRLSDFRGKKNVVLSFVPAAWTPVCSDQWPGYNIARELFEAHDAIIIGISVDNVPTLYAWTGEMGELWFPVVSDFWPHGGYASKLGILRGDGTSERAIVIIDKQGVIRWLHVNDINKRPELGMIMKQLDELNK